MLGVCDCFSHSNQGVEVGGAPLTITVSNLPTELLSPVCATLSSAGSKAVVLMEECHDGSTELRQPPGQVGLHISLKKGEIGFLLHNVAEELYMQVWGTPWYFHVNSASEWKTIATNIRWDH